jgi:hypothetical protein
MGIETVKICTTRRSPSPSLPPLKYRGESSAYFASQLSVLSLDVPPSCYSILREQTQKLYSSKNLSRYSRNYQSSSSLYFHLVDVSCHFGGELLFACYTVCCIISTWSLISYIYTLLFLAIYIT